MFPALPWFVISRVQCGSKLVLNLIGPGLTHNSDHLIVDLPVSWGLWFLEQRSEPSKWIVLSTNPCPEYKLDLYACGPKAVVNTLQDFAGIELLPDTVLPETPLSPAERLVLKLTAQGHSVDKIAQCKHTSSQHVKNTRHQVYNKLHLKTHTDVIHYYMGHWHFLLDKGWTPPPHVAQLATTEIIAGGGTNVSVPKLSRQAWN